MLKVTPAVILVIVGMWVTLPIPDLDLVNDLQQFVLFGIHCGGDVVDCIAYKWCAFVH